MPLNQDFSSVFNSNSSGAGLQPTAAPAAVPSPTPSAAPSGLTQDFSSLFAPQQQPQTTNASNTAKLDDVLASEGATALKPLVSAFYGQETSSGANAKTSVDGAIGPMQIMAATGAPYLKPGENLQANGLNVGTRILADYAKRYDGDPAKIAVAYFSGPGNVATSGPTPWKQDKADGNGTTVSQYVKGILTKLGSAVPVQQPAAAAPAPQAQPDQPAAPDLSQAPKWSDVVANPQFQKLDPATQQQTADAYFAKWIAPNTPADQLPSAQAEWAAKSAAAAKQATPPSLLSRIGSGITSAATSLVNNGFATDGTTPDNPAAQNAAVAQAPQAPNTAGVLGANNTPAAVAAAQKNLPPLPAMASPAMQQQVFQQFDAASPDQRQQMMQQPGVAGQLAQYRAAQYQNNTNPVSSDIGTSVEDRAQRLMNAGVDPAVARAQAQRDAASGAQTMIPGDMKATDFDFDTAARYRNANPIVRGAVQGVAGSAQSLVGIGRFVTDMTGAGNSDVADWLGNASKNISATSNAIGTSANPLARNLEAATSGLVQAFPAMLGAAAVPEAAALPLAQNGLQMFGQSYAEGRDAGQDPAQATTRAGMMGAFAVLGHALGLDSKLDAIRQSVAGASTDAIGTSLWNATIRDLPSTQAMALGNFITDKLPGGVGLTPEAKFTDWLQQAGDMFVQTAMMNGMLGAGAVGGAPLARTLRGEVKPTFDESSGTISDKNGNYWQTAPNTPAAPALGALGTSANAPHPSQVATDNAVREIAAAHGMDASALIPEPTPVPQPAAAPVAAPAAEAQPQVTPQPGQPLVWRNADTDIPVVYRGVAPDRGPDGRLYAQVEHNGTQSFVPFDELAPTTAAAPMQASPAETPAAQSVQPVADRVDPQQILEFAAQRRDALQAKQNGSLTPTLTPEGHEDVEQPGQQLTPTEHAEWDVLTKHANDPATIAHFYGLNDNEPAPAGEPPAPTPEQVDDAAHQAATSPKNDLPEPTQAQKEAGNYTKGHVDIHGLDVSIENPQGSTRSGIDPDGVVWENKLQDHYGYIRRTVGADDEHIDTFVGPNPASRKVFIVDQTAPDTSKFDEHKVMLGYDSMAEADAAYHRNYMDGWNGRGAISELPIGMFKEWLANGDTKAPFARAVSTSTNTAIGGKPKTEKEARAARESAQQPTSFKTSKGSTYVVHEDGTTTRNKAARDDVGHEGDSGAKPRTARTIYVDQNASVLSAAGLNGLGEKGARVVVKDGKATLLTWNDAAGKWGAAPSGRDIPIHHTPAVGRYPLELWKPSNDVPGFEAYRGMHAGNQITEIGTQPATPPKTEREAQARKQEKADGTTQAQDGAGAREARQETPGADRPVAGTEGAVDRPAAAAGAERGTGGRSADDPARAGRGVQPGAAGSGSDAVAGDVKLKTEVEARKARVERLVGKVGDIVRASTDFDYVKAGKPMRIERVEKSGAVRFVDPDSGSGTTVTRGTMDSALRKVTFEKVEPEALAEVPAAAPDESRTEPAAAEHLDLQDATGFARTSALSARPEPDRTSALTTLRRLSKRLDAGEITDAEFRLGAQNLLTRLENKREGQLDKKADRTRVRGDLYIRERLLRAERQGDITHAVSQFAQWLLDKNPAIADDLGIGVRGAKDGEGGTAGMYNSINRVVTLISGNTNEGTAVHEILHHTERMMPADIRSAIYKAWARDWQDAYKNATPEQKPFFAAMLRAAVGSQSAWADVAKGFKDGVLKYDEHYKLVNPSEYWAVKATDLMKSRYDAQGWIARAKQWLSDMIQKVRDIFGLSSDAPIIRGLDSVLKGEGEFTTDRMMAEKAPAESHDPADEVALHAIFHDLAKTPTERADDSYERARTIIDKSFDTKSTAKTFNWLERTFASQVHKAIKDPEFGRVFNAMRRMMNHTGLAATRAAEKAPMIVPHSDNFRQSVKTLFAGKRQSKQVAIATRALLDGTLAGDTVLQGKVWDESHLRSHYGMTDEGVKAYQQTRDAIDTSLDEVSAAEAYSMVHGLVPPEMREAIANEPAKAASLIRGSIDKKVDMFRKAHDKAVERGDMQKAEILHSLMMPYVETRKKVDDIFEKSELMKSSGYLPLMRFGKYTVYAHKIDPETGLSARDDETGQPLVHYFGMFPTEAEAKHEHEKQLALYKDDPDVKVSRGVKSEKAHQLYEGLSPETLSLFADKVGADTAMQTVIQLALSERSALKRRLGRRAITGFSEDLPRILSNFLTSNGRFAAQRFYMRDVNRAIQEIPKEKGDVMDEAIKLKQFVLNGDDPGSRTMAGMFLWTMAGSPVSAAVVASEPFQKIFPYLSQFGVGQASKGLGKALAYVLGRKQITDPKLRAAMTRAAREGIIKPQEIFHLYDLGMQNMSTWLSSQLAAHSGPGAAITKSVADGIRARTAAMSTMLGMMHSAAETFGRKMAFHAAWEVAKARGEKDPYAWTVRAIDEAGSQFGKINRANVERTYAGRMMLAYKSFTLGWLGLLFRMARKGGVEGARGVAVMLMTQMAMGGLAGLPFAQNFDDLVDTIGNAMGYNTDFAAIKRHWASAAFGKVFGDTFMHGLARHLPVDLSEHFGMGDIIPGTDLLKAENAKDKARNVLNVLGPQTQLITRMMDAYDAAAAGNYVKAGVAMAPNFIKRPMQGAAMLASGQSTDTQGRKIADASTFDAIAKMAGGATAHTNEQTEIRNEVRQAVATVQDKQSQIINMWARGIAQGDQDAVAKAQATLQQWNAKNPDSRIIVTPSALMSQVKSMREDANLRAIMSAPKGLKADAVSTLRGE